MANNPNCYPGCQQVETVKLVVGNAVGRKFDFNHPLDGYNGCRRRGSAVKWWFPDKEWEDIPALIIAAKIALFDEASRGLGQFVQALEVVECSKRSRHPGFRVLIHSPKFNKYS